MIIIHCKYIHIYIYKYINISVCIDTSGDDNNFKHQPVSALHISVTSHYIIR